MFKKSAARFLGLLALATLALVPWLSQPASATSTATGTLFAITQSQNLVRVDPGSGALTLVTSLFTVQSPQSADLTSDPTTHRLFAIRTSVISFNFPPVFTQEAHDRQSERRDPLPPAVLAQRAAGARV